MKLRIRESNYELLRIISMFFIVIGHVIVHGHVIENTLKDSQFIFNLLILFIIVHVNIFMLITGYYQSKSEFKLKKIILVLLQIAFYNLIINCILKFTGLVDYSNDEFLSQILFYNFESYWFIKCYIVVYLLSPFLNKLIDILDRKELKKMIILLICLFSIFPFITGNLFYSSNGLNLTQYIMLYFIGAYIRKFNLNKRLLKNNNSNQKRFIYFSLFIMCWIFNVSLFYLQEIMIHLDSSVLNRIAAKLAEYKTSYNNPFIMFQSLSIFMYFGTFKFKNRFINKISSLTFGIYLIHESYYIRENLYKWIGIDTGNTIYSKSIIMMVLIWAILIFTVCSMIEALRQLLFKFISKLKISKTIDNKFMEWLYNMIEVK